MSHSSTSDTQQPPGPGSRVVSTIFLAFFAGIGFVFLTLLGRQLTLNLAPYLWSESTCTILASNGQPDFQGKEHRFLVSYRYQWSGVELLGSSVHRGKSTADRYYKILEWEARYQPGRELPCYVRPEAPHEAVLERKFPVLGFFVVIPLIFIAIGVGGITAVWSCKAPAGVTPLSRRSTPRPKAALGFIFWTPVFVGSALGAYALLLEPLLLLQRSGSWREQFCRVLASRVLSQSSDDGDTYRPFILYSYESGGKTFRSDRRSVLEVSSSGRESKQAIVRQYRVGQTVPCYVDPADPTYSLLTREVPWFILAGLLPTALAFLAVWGLWRSGRALNGQREVTLLTTSSASHKSPSSPPATGHGVTLRPKSTRGGRLIGLLFATLFWNGILSVFLYQVIEEKQWYIMIFLAPFILVGLLLICFVPYTFLQLFNPHVILSLDTHPLVPGKRGRLRWKLIGRRKSMKLLRLRLRGVEEATYRRGTDTVTATETFCDVVLTEVENPELHGSGEIEISLSADAVPTFAVKSNEIRWEILVEGTIPRSPDLKEEFEIHVRPYAKQELNTDGHSNI